MKTSLLLTLAALSGGFAFADTFTLTNGTTYEGTILREDAENYTIEVQVTKSIKEERVIPKADVAKHEKLDPGLAAFEDIKSMIPVPDGADPAEYELRIRKVDKFLSEHRNTGKAPEARKIKETLASEMEQIKAGGKKVDGVVLSAADYRANAYDLDATSTALAIRKRIKNNQWLAALRGYLAMGAEFKNTHAYTSLAPDIARVIRGHLAVVNRQLANFDTTIKNRQLGLERMTPSDRTATERAIAEETKLAERNLAREKDAKLGWVTPIPTFKQSLADTVSFGNQELTRVTAIPATPAVDAGKLYRDILAMTRSGGDPAGISKAISDAKNAGLPAKYLDMLGAPAK